MEGEWVSSPTCLYLSNIPIPTTIEQLQELFAEYNPINILIPTRGNGRQKGFAFITFGSHGDLEAARISLDGIEFNNRELKLIPKLEKKSSNKNFES